MTSRSRLEIVGAPWSVRGFHGVRACSGVFWALSLSLHSLSPPSGDVNDTQVVSWRDYFRMSLLGGDILSRGVVRWTV
jgi:hypothetical protein